MATFRSNWPQAGKFPMSGLTYTFTLKDGLTFSNGRALTAADVAYSINRALDPTTQSPVASVIFVNDQGLGKARKWRLDADQ